MFGNTIEMLEEKLMYPDYGEPVDIDGKTEELIIVKSGVYDDNYISVDFYNNAGGVQIKCDTYENNGNIMPYDVFAAACYDYLQEERFDIINGENYYIVTFEETEMLTPEDLVEEIAVFILSGIEGN